MGVWQKEHFVNAVFHSLCRDYERLTEWLQRYRRSTNLQALGAAILMMVGAGQVIAQDQAKAPACKCRSPDGQMQDLGTVQCVNIVGRNSLVRCEMSTNTPYWKKVEGVAGCPDA